MSGYDRSGSYQFQTLERKYGGFISPSFQVKIDKKKVDNAKVLVSNLQIQICAESRAGMCTFTIEAMYDYETSSWSEKLLKTVDVGKSVEVEVGYADAKKRVFFGYIDKFQVDYSAQSAPQLHISAMDGMGFLMSNKEKLDFGKRNTYEVVKDLISVVKTHKLIEEFTIDTLPNFEGQFMKEKACSTFEFLCRLAEMCFVNFCVIDGQLMFSNLMENTSILLELTMGHNLISFSKTVAFSQNSVGSVTVISNGTTTKEEVRGVADDPDRYGREGGETGAEKWEGGNFNKDVTINFLKSAKECELVAQNILNSMSLGFISASGRCIGIPELIPGRYINISGMDEKTNGTYFVTSVTHSFSEEGYFTEFQVKGFRSK